MKRCVATLLCGLAVLAGPVAPVPAAEDTPMSDFKISGPFTHANLTIFLLHGKDTLGGRKLLTLQEALEQKKVVVHETEQVNELSVENVSGDVEVFVQSGDIVKGGKQDRLIASDLVVPPKSGKVPVPSFCCESGRWQRRGAEDATLFSRSESQAANKDVKLAVNAARRQDVVWAKVREAQMKLSRNVGKSVASEQSPSSYQLTLEDKDLLDKLTAYEKALAKAPEGKPDVVGVALVINGKVEGAEVYGSPALFAKLWPKLLKAAAVDALAEFEKDKKFAPAAAADVEKFLAAAAGGKKTEVDLRASSGGAAQQQLAANRPAASPQAPAPAQPAKAPPVTVIQYDSAKAVLIESRDREKPATVIHRSYIAK